MTGPSPEIRPLTPGDDLAQDLDLARRAFGTFDPGEGARRLASASESVAAGRSFGAFAGYLADDGFLAYGWSGGHSEMQVDCTVVRGDRPRAVVRRRLARLDGNLSAPAAARPIRSAGSPGSRT